MLGLGQQPPCITQCLLRLKAQGLLFEVDVEAFEGTQAIVLYALETLHRRQVGFQALGFHQRLARQVEQAVQALSRDPQYALATLGDALGLVHSLRRRGQQ
ncbi:hypothetical protein D3C85_1701330 [compost metagenome]